MYDAVASAATTTIRATISPGFSFDFYGCCADRMRLRGRDHHPWCDVTLNELQFGDNNKRHLGARGKGVGRLGLGSGTGAGLIPLVATLALFFDLGV
jgi:hypothetical protein